ncbi:hypothetical protein LNTAR_25425 [Lentisphaera araneosa HTCC2155]|uniref:Uncharacterized protein n=1 Tax=Lentisphaera araneosa HTCC2155 TaxID=313628 RepID=A6DSC7_9BACT|nr:hypothetical protein [Lentisphaera araneosa]EDM25472.1 hypothetical protein LNTAR_25425 [Lentisphaera araneosa HTCC2155]
MIEVLLKLIDYLQSKTTRTTIGFNKLKMLDDLLNSKENYIQRSALSIYMKDKFGREFSHLNAQTLKSFFEKRPSIPEFLVKEAMPYCEISNNDLQCKPNSNKTFMSITFWSLVISVIAVIISINMSVICGFSPINWTAQILITSISFATIYFIHSPYFHAQKLSKLLQGETNHDNSN